MKSSEHGTSLHPNAGEACASVPEFRRLKYFYGQMLSADDFNLEQAYFREKLKLHNRCLHGYGVVCGLLVEPVPIPKECAPVEEENQWKDLFAELAELLEERAKQQAAAAGNPVDTTDVDKKIDTLRVKLAQFYKEHCREEPRTHVRIDCGLALDCQGNELVINKPVHVDLLQWLSNDDYKRVQHGAHTLYVSLCYCEQSLDPVRPVVADACGSLSSCNYGKIQDTFRIQVTVDPPIHDDRCETCCSSCKEPCLLLAKITGFIPGYELHHQHIHNEVRRPLSRYVPAGITGVSWQHGHTYTSAEAAALLGTFHPKGDHPKGLKICFSRPIAVSTIRHGVMDVWRIEGGRGRSASITNRSGKFIDLPPSGYTDHIYYRDTTGEHLDAGDRVLIILRTDFLLDKCCQPVDGENTGGRVPQLEEYVEKYGVTPHEPDVCRIPPSGYLPWRSGNSIPGGKFESWFYVRERDGYREHGESGETSS